jgi:hypothetical protein
MGGQPTTHLFCVNSATFSLCEVDIFAEKILWKYHFMSAGIILQKRFWTL